MKFPTTILTMLCFATSALAALPAPPKGVKMTANTPNSVTLVWLKQEGDLTGYNVYASDTPKGEYKKVTTVTTRTVTVGDLQPGAIAYYQVTAVNADGESKPSDPAGAMSIKPVEPTLFPFKVAGDMCLTHDAKIIANEKPMKGKIESLVDGLDATGCRFKDDVEIKIKLNDNVPFADAEYLMVNFRVDWSPYDFANDAFARPLKQFVITESADSTDGKDGTWEEVASGKIDRMLDGVIVIPNHKPKWIGIKNSGNRDLILCRLDVFRSAPAGFRNDYWIFTGDSLVVQDLPGGPIKGRTVWFSDQVRKRYPNRYPMVVHHARGGTMLKDTHPFMKAAFPTLCPPNEGKTPTGSIVVWETGFNDVGVGASFGTGQRVAGQLAEAQALCAEYGAVLVPVRIEWSPYDLNKETWEPMRANVFYNTLIVNLGGVDAFAREKAPYTVDPATQLPYADYWSYTKANWQTALTEKDGVHHTVAGQDGINQLWADVAGKMVYGEKPLPIPTTQP